MQFATGTGLGAYYTNSSLTSVYDATSNFVNFNTPNSFVTLSGGSFPQRTFTQGNVVPGMFLNYTANASASNAAYTKQWLTSYSCRFALGSPTAGSDVGNITITLNASSDTSAYPGWAGLASIQLQGSYERFAPDPDDWINVGSPVTLGGVLTGLTAATDSATLSKLTYTSGSTSSTNPFQPGQQVWISGYTSTGASTYNGLKTIASIGGTSGAWTFVVQLASNFTTAATGTGTAYYSPDKPVILQVTTDYMMPCYRLQSILTTSVAGDGGVINWTVPNMFVDLSAEQVGSNATKLNGSIGQENIQVNSSKPFGRETSWVGKSYSTSSYSVVSTSGNGSAQVYVTNSAAASQPFVVGTLVNVTGASYVGSGTYNTNQAIITAVAGSQNSWSFSIAGAYAGTTSTATATIFSLATGSNQAEIGTMFTPGGQM